MEKLIIEGGHPLRGTVNISGFKNAAVAIIPAAILAGERCVIENLPDIKDVHILGEILQQLGAEVSFDSAKGAMEIDSSMLEDCVVPYEMAGKLRASYYFLGAAIGRFGKARVAYPGGCDIGARPIDQHIKGFEALGAKVKIEHGMISVEAQEPVGAKIYLDVVSVERPLIL